MTSLLTVLATASVCASELASAQVLYAISGDGATPASTLYTLDLASGGPNLVGALGNGDSGEGIAFGPDTAILHHSSGATDGLEFLETVNPDSLAIGPNLAPGGTYGPAPAGELFSLGWYAPLGVFLAIDINFDFFHVTAAGQFTLVGNSGTAMRGFARVGAQVFGVSPFAQDLYEVDPNNGAILATLPLSVDGTGTTGNGLATHPVTGVVYVIVKNPASPPGGRLLATLDVTTGQATSIGDTGLKLAGITFRTHAPLYAISGDGASPPSTLYRLDLGNAAPTLATTLGNGTDGEAIGSRTGDGFLYHTSGVSDGSEFLEKVDPDTWAVGSNLMPGDAYGPDPAREITAIGWYPPLGVFLVGDIDNNFYHVTPSGQFSLVGNSGLRMRGFAVVGSQVFGVNPFAHQLLEVDPSNGAVLATLPLSVDGTGTTGNGLATSPDTGAVFAILKNPFLPGGGRLLARIDVTTGKAISIGDTGHKLAGITFGYSRPPPPPIPALGRLGQSALAAALLAAAFGVLCSRTRTGAEHPRHRSWQERFCRLMDACRGAGKAGGRVAAGILAACWVLGCLDPMSAEHDSPEAPGRTGICGTLIYNPGAVGFKPTPISTEIRVLDADGTLVATARSDALGRYEVETPPGTYRVVLPDFGVTRDSVVVEEGACIDAYLRIDAPSRRPGS